jgi:superoxide oxidase
LWGHFIGRAGINAQAIPSSYPLGSESLEKRVHKKSSLDGRPIASIVDCCRQYFTNLATWLPRRLGTASTGVSTFPDVDTTLRVTRRPSFDSVTIVFHWVSVLIVLAMFVTAWLHSQSHDDVRKVILLQIHRSLGVTIWVVTVSRLVWRLTKAKLPPFPQNMPKVQQQLAKASEYALYALLLVQPGTGLAATLLRGRQFALFFWEIPQLVPEKALWVTFDLTHKIGAWALGALILGHAAAALFHHFVLRDDVLQCMAPVIARERRKQEFLPGRVVRNQHF